MDTMEFELGDKIFTFDMQSDSPEIMMGVVIGKELTRDGYLNYKVMTSHGHRYAAPVNIAYEKEDAEAQIKAFLEHRAAQEEMTNKYLPAAKFNMDELTKDLPKLENKGV